MPIADQPDRWANSMSFITYAFLVAVWVAGFAAGYLLRSYLSYRRRTRAQRARYRLPESQGWLTLVPGLGEDFTTLVPQDCPIRSEQRAGDGRRSSPPLGDSGSRQDSLGHRS